MGLVVLLAALTGCRADGPAGPPGDDDCSVRGAGGTEHEMSVDGTERTYVVYAPHDVPPNTRIPVVYLFHGLGVGADAMAAYSALPEAGYENGFMVVAPQGVGDPVGWDFRTPVEQPGSDLDFARELMDEVVAEHCTMPERQYVAGMSNGSVFTFAIACSGAFPVQAYAGVAAVFGAEHCPDAPPVDLLYMHGTDDELVPFEGGPTLIGQAPPAMAAIESWAAHDGCTQDPERAEVADDVELFRWTCSVPGADDRSIDTYVIDGGGHTWPGALPMAGVGETSDGIDATGLMVGFFGLDTGS